MTHQYIERSTQAVLDEKLFGDRIIRFLYSRAREYAPALIKTLTGPATSSLMGYLNFDLPLAGHLLGNQRFLRRCGVDLNECVAPATAFKTPRDIFERQIRYWECRPMDTTQTAIYSPCDARVTLGSMQSDAQFYIKDKFFTFDEMLGQGGAQWNSTFSEGDFAIFRLTPDKYHFNHTPVSGTVVDHYTVAGAYHSCNPTAMVEVVTPLSKNKRIVTIFDTDVDGGSGIGHVCMIEIVALMIGAVEQQYADEAYDNPQPVAKGLQVKAGQPKSLYRPGSSTTVLFFEPDRIAFAADLLENQQRADVNSRFSTGLGHPLVETDVQVRSTIAFPK